MRLNGQTAIVTGAATGIGRAIAMAFAAEGAAVVVDYHGNASTAASVAAEIARAGGRAIAVAADVSRLGDVERLVDKAESEFGPLRIMVNNAGVEEKHPFLEMPLDVFERVVEVNLKGVWIGAQIAARAMARHGKGGRIINISSIHEDLPMPTNAPYCAAKGGVRMLTRTIAVELASYGITVNDVCPGAVETPMDATLTKEPREYAELIGEIPLRRMAKPEEVAELCVYLASPQAAYVTGASYVIDGGMMRKSSNL